MCVLHPPVVKRYGPVDLLVDVSVSGNLITKIIRTGSKFIIKELSRYVVKFTFISSGRVIDTFNLG